MSRSGSESFLRGKPLRELRSRLQSWYAQEHRDLPWRRAADPYATLVSEFMLQQTQVATVLPYYEAFLRRFPTLQSLARAGEDDVRAAWSGLGYYRRARNLQASARILISDYAGMLPDRPELLRELPGVGPYTAAALASIVHAVPKAVVDGNVIRVLTRLTAEARSPSRAQTRRDLEALADLLLDPQAPGDWNQAVMELGARVCTPTRPRCDVCPWRNPCRARSLGTPEAFPRKDPRPAPLAVDRLVGVFRREQAVLLVRREDLRLLDGTWEFPGVEVNGTHRGERALARSLQEWLGRPVRVGAELARTKHSITHRRLTLRAFSARSSPPPRARAGYRRWVDAKELEALPVSSMTVKLMNALDSFLQNPR